MKDAARLLAYLAATVLFGALCAPVIYWTAQALGGRGSFSFLAQYDFQKIFHRSLLVGALIFVWPFLRTIGVRSWRDLHLEPNPHRLRDLAVGFVIAATPLLCFAAGLVAFGVYSLRSSVSMLSLLERIGAVAVVPLLEEPLFRGLILGVLLRGSPAFVAMLATSAFFSIVHFLKAPEQTSATVTWMSGFASIANSFHQFQQPLLLLAGFCTLFMLGWILADARVRTRSLWAPIGLHAGWIFANAMFSKIARREYEALPWFGRNLLIGLAPLCVALVSWGILRLWLKHVAKTRS